MEGEAATHGIFDEQAKTRSPQMWAATHRPLLGGALAAAAAVGAQCAGAPRSMTAARSLTRGSPPHVLREYALLADGERGILVGPHGDFVWMCFPRWDSEGLFSSLSADRARTRSRPPNATSGAATTSRGA